MSDCDETDVFWDFLVSPGKTKTKRKRKNPQKTPKRGKHRNDSDAKANERRYDDANKKKKMKKKKKKTPPKNKEAMEKRNARKKEWKKGKNKKKKAPDDSFVFRRAAKPEPETPRHEKPKPDRIETKTKRKKVAFDLSPRYIAVKRPKFSPSTHNENKAAKGGESHCQSQPNDSQCTSDDINSQDLFITQKTFRTSPQEPASGEAPAETPPPIARPLPDGSDVQQHRINTAPKEEEDEEERWFFTQKERFPRQKESNSKPRGANPFLDDPVVVISSLDVSKSSQQSPSLPPRRASESTTSSTQTENFFTTELSSYLGFCQRSQRLEDVEPAEPLDLSLPLRARSHLGSRGVEIGPAGPGRCPSCSSDSKEAEVKKGEEPPGRRRCSVCLQRKQGKSTPSPQSESEAKSGEATTSSEDYDGPGKPDLTQVRAVQTRLNESFFFKTKGNGPSQRPASPLMKLDQGREVKGSKGHHHRHHHQRS